MITLIEIERNGLFGKKHQACISIPTGGNSYPCSDANTEIESVH